MFYAYVKQFDVTSTVEFFFRTKQSLGLLRYSSRQIGANASAFHRTLSKRKAIRLSQQRVLIPWRPKTAKYYHGSSTSTGPAPNGRLPTGTNGGRGGAGHARAIAAVRCSPAPARACPPSPLPSTPDPFPCRYGAGPAPA